MTIQRVLDNIEEILCSAVRPDNSIAYELDTKTKKCFYQAEIKDMAANSIMIVGLSQVIAKDM